MPFLKLNDAELHYATFGQPGQPPVLLIHGSTITGHTDWGEIAPLLADRYHVIVPDCRGHGRSANPQATYSFKELAADGVGMIRALGYERAHIIGHSNGGNVALVMLMEFPEAVLTCIPQAANAYVSQDLIDREPPLFEPDRVARESPQWMEEMIALHGPTHGPNYWRTLLRLTLHETITQPNYTAADLARVQHPTLVIQGEKDGVNAPAQHAQFIAQHIPGAELWLPLGIGHNVHIEIPHQWIERVRDFLVRHSEAI
jgi:pimeloyl-ACP methyl ester carboxylesterase